MKQPQILHCHLKSKAELGVKGKAFNFLHGARGSQWQGENLALSENKTNEPKGWTVFLSRYAAWFGK